MAAPGSSMHPKIQRTQLPCTVFLPAAHYGPFGLLVLVLSVVLLTLPARANDWTHWRSAAVAADGAPASVVYCEGFTDGYQAGFGADFVSVDPLSAVRIRFDFYDAFGTLLQSERGDVTGAFAPAARIQRSGDRGWHVGALHFTQLANVAEIRCTIEKTVALDGTQWTNTNLPALAGEQ